jgi:DNA-binding response OmpR family regulator
VSKSVLVVEDSATMREMVSQTLKEAGFEPLVGKNGQDGPKLPLSDGGHHDNRSGR